MTVYIVYGYTIIYIYVFCITMFDIAIKIGLSYLSWDTMNGVYDATIKCNNKNSWWRLKHTNWFLVNAASDVADSGHTQPPIAALITTTTDPVPPGWGSSLIIRQLVLNALIRKFLNNGVLSLYINVIIYTSSICAWFSQSTDRVVVTSFYYQETLPANWLAIMWSMSLVNKKYNWWRICFVSYG